METPLQKRPRALRQYAQEHAGAGAKLELAGRRGQNDDAERIGASGVRDAHTLHAVNAASIGRKEPQCLQAVITIERAATGSARLRPDVHQDSVIECSAHGMIFAIGDLTARAINSIAADLSAVRPRRGGAKAEGLIWNLRQLNGHRGGQSPQIDGDSELLMIKGKLIEREGNGFRSASCCGSNG